MLRSSSNVDLTVSIYNCRAIICHGVARLVIFISHGRLGKKHVEAMTRWFKEKRPEESNADGDTKHDGVYSVKYFK